MTTLPAWDEMSDLDKGAALLHIHKREWEGVEYAVDNYPAEYFDHPALLALTPQQASEHAAQFDGPVPDMDPNEYARLYDAALDADHKRMTEHREERNNDV